MYINVFSVRAIVSWFIWTIGKRWFGSSAINCIWIIPWSFHNEVISVVICNYLGIWESDIAQWKSKRSANNSCIVQSKVVIANLYPIRSIEDFSSSPNSLESSRWVGHIFWVCQSIVSTDSMVWCSWASNNNVFRMSTVADISVWTLIETIFTSWAWDIIHQNWFLNTIWKINASAIW
jgi:hypothetical protein